LEVTVTPNKAIVNIRLHSWYCHLANSTKHITLCLILAHWFCYIKSLKIFHFVLFILRVLLILSRLFRATICVFFVPCCPVLLSSYLVLSYMFERNKWRWRYDVIHNNGVRNNGNIMSVQYYCTVVIIRAEPQTQACRKFG